MNEVVPALDFAREVEEESGQPVLSCYQCRKCSSGCPLSFVGDLQVHQVMRLVQLGLREEALSSRSAWLCVGCRTCQARCPNGIDGSRVMDALKAASVAAGVAPGDARCAAFHSSFLSTVRAFGRAYELGMMALFKLKTKALFEDLALGVKLFTRGRLKLLPERSAAGEVRRLFRRVGGGRQ